jgi:sec-independent protein translocase protein TatA
VPNIGLPEIAMVLVIALIVFGPKRLPDMGRQLGKTIREFRDATSDIRSQIGIDDIADSVKDLKSGLSLTSTDTRAVAATADPGAIEPAAGTGHDSTVDTSPADDRTADEPRAALSSNRPVATGQPPAAPVRRNGPVGVAPALAGPFETGSPAATVAAPGAGAPAADAAPAVDAATGIEGGIEGFGKVTRRSSSSSVRPTAG